MIPGQLNDVFCLKELKYIVNHFDEVYVYSYPGDKKSYARIAEQYGIKYEVIKDFTLYSILRSMSPSLLKGIGIGKEVKRILSLKGGVINTLKRFVYLMLYINFGINANREYEKIEKSDAVDYLYGCWMSRGAFACAFMHQQYKNAKDKEKRSSVENCVLKAHGYDLYEERRRVNYIPFRRYIYENMENMYFVSRKGCEYYKEKYGWDSQKYHVCHLGTDQPNYRKSIREKNEICIASCSSAWTVKRMDLIIDIISRLDANVRYVHIGDGPLLNEIKEYANRKLDGKSNVAYEFLGRIDNSRIYEVYDKYDADFFVNMSDSEGLPVSMMEASAFGLPIICRDVGGNPEIVSEDNGIVVHYENNIEEIAESINQLVACRLNDIEKYRKLSRHAQQVWEDEFNAPKNYNSFAEEIKSYTKR